MREKLMSGKFWITILANAIFIVSIFTNLGGTLGTVFCIIGMILSSISYVFIEGKIDTEKVKVDSEETKKLSGYY